MKSPCSRYATRAGHRFCPPIGHRQERGDYRESWQPARDVGATALAAAQDMARARSSMNSAAHWGSSASSSSSPGDEVIFSELSPRPHDTGMVTLASQNLTEFDLHARAILGLPGPAESIAARPAASAVILADRDSERAIAIRGPRRGARAEGGTDLRIFGKPTTRPIPPHGRRPGARWHASRKPAARPWIGAGSGGHRRYDR
jgi:phosphoribosylglycinamide formyltransferase 2